jgi:hypothetical protein
MSQSEKINYVEFPTKNLMSTKKFFEQAFGWTFEDFGPEYTAFSNQGIDGGFFKADLTSTARQGSALIVLLSENLEETQSKIESSGGKISEPIFAFPGGRRFHFIEPGGNELAVWQKSDL